MASGPTGRREQILLTAAELFAVRGYEATTIRDIARRLEIRPSGLYHYFASKEEIVRTVLTGFSETVVGEYERAIARATDDADAIRRMIRVAFDAIVAYRHAITIIQRDFAHFERHPRFEHIRLDTRRVQELWVDTFERGIRAGAFRNDVRSVLLFLFVRDTVWATVRWFRPDDPISIEEVTDSFTRIFMRGVLAP